MVVRSPRSTRGNFPPHVRGLNTLPRKRTLLGGRNRGGKGGGNRILDPRKQMPLRPQVRPVEQFNAS